MDNKNMLFPQDARFDLAGGRYEVFREDDAFIIATDETEFITFPAYACCWVRECGDSGSVVYEHVPADPRYLDTLDLDDEKHAESLLIWYMHLSANISRAAGDVEAADIYNDCADYLLYS